MPYCPKCDMEFVEGITVCSDCGGALAESEEKAKEIKQRELEEKQKEELIRQIENRNAMMEFAAQEADVIPSESMKKMAKAYEGSKVYVKKEQRYEDLKSSASAFLIVGSLLFFGSLLCWTGIINLPAAKTSKILMQSVMTVMGAVSIIVYLITSKSAKKMQSEITSENTATKGLIEWFSDHYKKEDMDQAILSQDPDLSPEELSLKRFELIQDCLITNHDLPDQSYVELLCEEIYSIIFES